MIDSRSTAFFTLNILMGYGKTLHIHRVLHAVPHTFTFTDNILRSPEAEVFIGWSGCPS